MERAIVIGGTAINAAIGAIWWFCDKTSFLAVGWLVVVCLGVSLTGVAFVLREPD